MEQTGLIGGAEQRTIEILDYNPQWPEQFQTQRNIVAKALGDVALRIEHIGSTSVPGLAAKPILDMLLAVADSADEAQYLPQLVAAGYELRVREPDFHEHRMFRTTTRDVHLHVFPAGSPEIDRYLIFRDELRRNAGQRARYEATKRALATKPWPDMNAYAEAKSEVVESIIASAQAAGRV
jgi:GrpB-like predicted nucleotidyltransferase (UPF0157 family)